MRVFTIRHTQELQLTEEGLEQTSQVEAVFDKSAATGGFLARLSQRAAGKALHVLTAMALHSRPLVGEEFRLLRAYDLVREEDEGKLFCWMTKKGIAAVLGVKWHTIDTALKWLLDDAIICAVTLPDAFVERHIRSRGQFTSNIVYVLNTNGLLHTEWRDDAEAEADADTDTSTVAANGPRSESTVTANGRRSGDTVAVNGPWSESTVAANGRRSENPPSPLNGATVAPDRLQSLLKQSTTDDDTTRAGAETELSSPLAALWQRLTTTALPTDTEQALMALLAQGQTSLAVIGAVLQTAVQYFGPAVPPDVFVGILTGSIVDLPWENPALPPHLPLPPPVPVPIPEGNGVLGQVMQWYEQEIGIPLTALAADELRDLTGKYRDVESWRQAFTKAAATQPGLPRWRYVVACMEDSNGKFRMARRQKRDHTDTSSTHQPAGAAKPTRSKRRRPPLGQWSDTERAQLEAAAQQRLAELGVAGG